MTNAVESKCRTRYRSLEGKIAIVTGGTRGIGAAIVRRLSREGATVAFTYISSAAAADELNREIKEAGGVSASMKADSALPIELQRTVNEIAEAFGGVDIFVSNAGIFRSGVLEQFALEELDQLVAVNIRAAFIGIQAAARKMRDGGRIITIGSSAADRIAFPGTSAYSMTKAAMQGLVRGAAVDLAPRRITVNNVQPGPVATDINPVNGMAAEALINMISLGRYGTEDEIASLVAYLASPASAFITGANLTADGGYRL
jgi:3-oxoacyl-[acyl-carrier protein] reductase